MAKNNVADLDTTAANNTDYAGTDSTGTTGLVKNGDNILRTIGAMLKKWWNDLSGQVTVGGTANAITITSSSTYQSLVSGIRIMFKPGADNSGATTLNLDSLGVKAVRKISGGTDVALAGGEILNAQRAEVVYDSTANSSAGAWILLNPVSTTSYQPLDSDLTTIAGLTATTDNFIQSKSSAWASRTPTQVTADLIAVVGDSGSGGTKGLVPAPSAGDAAALKFLKADGTWATPSGNSMTLLGTLTTTSGSTQSITSIAAGYRAIFCEVDGVSFSTATSLTVATSSTNGAAYGTAGTITGALSSGAGTFIGAIWIYNVSSAAQSQMASSAMYSGGDKSVAVVPCVTNTAAVVNAIQFAGGTFDAGAIRVYGVK